MLICGVDEAGRGAVLGSLVVSAVVFDPIVLESIAVADSKKLSKKRREQLEEQITEHAHEIVIVELTAQDINTYHRQGLTLNQMEVLAFAHALNDVESIPDEIYLDAADVSEYRFRDNIITKYKYPDIPIVAEHKADLNIPVVSAASIIAKVYRDSVMEKLAPVSGYPDSKTKQWLKEYHLTHNKFPKFARYFWKTLEHIKS